MTAVKKDLWGEQPPAWLVLCLVAGVMLIAFMTNPSQAGFEFFLKEQLRLESGQDDFISWAGARLGIALLRGSIHRQDFKLFSVYVIDLPGTHSDIRAIGAFRAFFVLSAL